jgi:hypothetical protein
MLEERIGREPTETNDLEFRKGCRACERSDPALERDLQAFAQLLFEIYLARHKGTDHQGHSVDVDNVR